MSAGSPPCVELGETLYRGLAEWSVLAVLGTAMTVAHLVAGRRPEVLVPVLVWCVIAGYGPLIAWTIQRRKLPNKGLYISRWTDK